MKYHFILLGLGFFGVFSVSIGISFGDEGSEADIEFNQLVNMYDSVLGNPTNCQQHANFMVQEKKFIDKYPNDQSIELIKTFYYGEATERYIINCGEPIKQPDTGICYDGEWRDTVIGTEFVRWEAPCITEMQEKSSNGGGCLIATATYGSELSSQVQQLRELRDNTLLQTESGSTFMSGFNQFYYSFSPTIADWERENPVFKETVKVVITPLIASLSILNYIDMNSEAEVLGYGISLILLNIGMYFVAPAIVIHRVRKLV